jgi:hypothetical protein
MAESCVLLYRIGKNFRKKVAVTRGGLFVAGGLPKYRTQVEAGKILPEIFLKK